MEIRVKFDAALWLICALCAVIATSALLMAYPSLWPWIGDNASSIASWVQAIGSLLAIWATWLIASRQSRSDRKQELRLAAIDGATMHAEIWRAITILDRGREIAKNILDKPNENLGIARVAFNSYIQNHTIRPLIDQDKLVVIGFEYLSAASEVLDESENLKLGSSQVSQMFLDHQVGVFDELEKLIDEIAQLQKSLRNMSTILSSFSSKYGIRLKAPNVFIECFDDEDN